MLQICFCKIKKILQKRTSGNVFNFLNVEDGFFLVSTFSVGHGTKFIGF